MIILFLLLSQLTFGQNNISKQEIKSSNSEFEQKMFLLINNYRKKNNLKPLQWNESLANAARFHAQDMIKDKYFEHDSYDRINGKLKKSMKTFDRVRKFLDKGLFAHTENIGTGQFTAKEMFNDWKNSPGHRKNMLMPDTKYIGIGYIYDENDEFQHYWVMDSAY